MNDDFAVRFATECMPCSDEFSPQFLKVINLAIERRPHVTRLVGHRHATIRREIDDRQPTVSQSHVVFDPTASVIRTAIDQRIAQALHGQLVDRFTVRIPDAKNSAQATISRCARDAVLRTATKASADQNYL